MAEPDDLVGMTVLIGISNYEADGVFIGQEQMFGTIKEVNSKNVAIELDDGTPYYLPPDASAFHVANKGEYKLRSTGKIVKDPDFICTYSITKPQKH
jgi:hypothetical protein